MKPEENKIINELNFCMIVLNWNRAQKNPPIEITKEYFVAQELLKLFSQGKPKPIAQFDDPRVQTVYEILCADEAPPKGEHWEGFIARRIVDALAKPEQEPVAWRNAAIRLGEDLYSVGPNGYYEMTAKQWLDWALSVVNTTPPRKEWVGLTDEDIKGLLDCDRGWMVDIKKAEQILKDKNT
jgi:hypothetical protein